MTEPPPPPQPPGPPSGPPSGPPGSSGPPSEQPRHRGAVPPPPPSGPPSSAPAGPPSSRGGPPDEGTSVRRSRAPQVGSTFGHYRIDGVIGVGGMGMVFAATDLRLGRAVALKVVLGHYAESESFQRRFQREAALLAKLDSPHVISIYDHGELDGWPYLVTQYAAGGDLGRAMRERGALPPRLAATLCAQLCDALVAAQEVGVVHRDVKPANVLLRDDRLDRMHVYLADFGVAADAETTGLTAPGSVAGTWNYLAPERAQGGQGTGASDLYSVGCLFYEALTGRAPYVGSDVEVAMAHLQAPVPQLPGTDEFTVAANEILARSMAKDPAQRFSGAAEMRERLRAIGGGLTTPTPGSTPPRFVGHTTRRRRRLLAAGAGALVLALLAGAAVLWWPGGDGDDVIPMSDAVRPIITADFDTNGFGDVILGSNGGTATINGSGVVRMRSTGIGFKAPRQAPRIQMPLVQGDFDGDRQLDLVQVDGDPPEVTVEVHYTDRSTSPAAFSTPEGDPGPTAIAGDFDGDGVTDLAIASTDGTTVSVSVALSEGRDGFAPAEVWGTVENSSTSLFAVADLDDDGDDDLVAMVTSADGIEENLRPMISSGSEFENAELQSLDDFSTFTPVLRGGDFDGSGAEELALVESVTSVQLLRWDGEQLVADEEPWFDAGQSFELPRDVAVSDLDGDGLDDLVLLNPRDGGPNDDVGSIQLRALRSEGESFTSDPVWTTSVPLDITTLAVDRAVWDRY